jgi:hypothetical protein
MDETIRDIAVPDVFWDRTIATSAEAFFRHVFVQCGHVEVFRIVLQKKKE